MAETSCVPGRVWHPGKKHWTDLFGGNTLGKIGALFADELVELDPAVMGSSLIHNADPREAWGRVPIPEGLDGNYPNARH